ncbi:site-specific integrase [Bacteroides salyersiae]|uniref:tyrosine-type recombinase/integrase n=1 Tax=Bacteroides salyersiae TaxID=291644 RepID=UPI001C38EA1C|nr:site-specific integrase [Bacteroides salyersiae]MBV4204647.1 site-specific integrase [Bacteroides salyersiae]MCB6650160.1 site-specific integrase [Bacteroides salyersiae]
MTTVKVKFRPSTVKDRPGTIIYLVTHRRIARQITTGYKVFPREWDEEQSKPIAADNDERTAIVQSIIRKLRSDMERLEAIIERFENGHSSYSSEDVVAEFRRTGGENAFFIFMENTIERLRQLNHSGTAKNYRAALGSFKRFRGNEDILMGMIDQMIMEDYQAYLKSAGLTPNSISFYMRILRAVYNRAVEQELTIDRNPFRTVFTGVEKTRKRAISISDIKRFRDLDLSLKPNLEFARNLFLFLFFCRGMSFIDAAFLKKSDIQNGMLTYRRHKTNQVLHIKIIEPIKELVDRYSSNDSPYLLPIITRPHCDERRQYETALRRVNKSLKIIAGMVKLPIPLTTYVSRHAWATIAKSKNIPVNVISDALGHDSIATTQIYLASIDTSTIDRANELIIKDL